MNLIFSADQNWGIGRENKLLFHIKPDLARFKALTTGKVVVMGHKTLLSLPKSKPLPSRTNIVLSRDPDLYIEGAAVCGGVDSLLEKISAYPSGDVFVIGGEQVYKLLMPYCDKAYVTKIHASTEADSFMENLDLNADWQLAESSGLMEYDGLRFEYCLYKCLK